MRPCAVPAAVALQYLQLQQKHRAAERQLKALTAGQQQQSGGDSSEGGSPPARPDVAAAQDASPLSQQQRQRRTAASSSPQRRKRAGSAAAVGGGAAGAAGSGAASWPALCAELEGEVEGLKAQLGDAARAAEASQQQVRTAAWVEGGMFWVIPHTDTTLVMH
jgi:hypothetical protein